MNIIVDTSVWSPVLRRDRVNEGQQTVEESCSTCRGRPARENQRQQQNLRGQDALATRGRDVRDTFPTDRQAHIRTFRACIDAGHGLFMLGPILQELLDGLRSTQQSARLLSVLKPIPLAPLRRETYVLAAQMRNDCRKKGIQAGPTDFLIAAACVESGYPLLTADQDFDRIAACTELVLVPVASI